VSRHLLIPHVTYCTNTTQALQHLFHYDQSARLDSGSLQVYITGHGGDGFMKFQDKEEVTSDEIGKAFALVSTQLFFLGLALLHCLLK
jgi:hypothetical protein